MGLFLYEESQTPWLYDEARNCAGALDCVQNAGRLSNREGAAIAVAEAGGMVLGGLGRALRSGALGRGLSKLSVLKGLKSDSLPRWKPRRTQSTSDKGLKNHARRHGNLTPAEYLRRGQENILHGRMLAGGGRAPSVRFWIRKLGPDDFSMTIVDHRGDILSIDTWWREGGLTRQLLEDGFSASGMTPPRGFWDSF
jgi:hypothetical protein